MLEKIKIKFNLYLSVILLGSLFLVPSLAHAQKNTPVSYFNQALQKGGLVAQGGSVTSISDAVGIIINSVLLLVGVITFALMVYAGSLWILAAGNDEQIKKAKSIIFGSVIGLIIVFSAFVIVNFVLDQIANITGN